MRKAAVARFLSSHLQGRPWVLRQITSLAAQHKLNERVSLGVSEDYVLDKPEKSQNIVRLRFPNRPAHLTEATAKLKACTRARDYDAAWEIFEATDPDIPLKNAALHLCAKAAWQERAWHLWGQMSRPYRDIVSYCTMMDVCARCQQADKAEEVFKEMLEEGFEADIIAYNSLINAFSMSGRADKALQYFQSLPPDLLQEASLSNQQVAFQAVMIACAREANYTQTRELFVQMTSAGVAPNHAHFNALLTACAHGSQGDLAQGVFNLMTSYNVSPNVVNWTILLTCNRNNLARCKEILQEMEDAGIQPSSLTYLELLGAHVLAKDGPGARALIADVERLGQWKHGWKLQKLLKQIEQLP